VTPVTARCPGRCPWPGDGVLIRAAEATFTWGPSEAAVPVLRGVSFAVRRGTLTPRGHLFLRVFVNYYSMRVMFYSNGLVFEKSSFHKSHSWLVFFLRLSECWPER